VERNPYLSDPEGGDPLIADCFLECTPCAKYVCVTSVYDGFVYDENNSVRGTVTLTAKPNVKLDRKTGDTSTNWSFTAKAVLQTTSLSFSGKAAGFTPGRFTASTKNNAETLDVVFDAGRVYGAIWGAKVGGEFYVDGARNFFADKKDIPAQLRLADFKGRYNVALIDGTPADGMAAGYASLSIGNLGVVKFAGKLADGASFSGSGKLLDGMNDEGWLCIALHRPLYTKKGYIGMLLWLNPDDMVLRVDTDMDWFADWVCEDPKKVPFAVKLDVAGGWFSDGKAQVAPPPGLGFFAFPGVLPNVEPLGGIWIHEMLPIAVPVNVKNMGMSLTQGAVPKKIGAGLAASYQYDLMNTSRATLSYAAKTGLFKGSFKLYYDAFDAKDNLQHKTFNAPYNGLLIPTRDAAYAAWPIGLGVGTTSISKQKIGVPVYLIGGIPY